MISLRVPAVLAVSLVSLRAALPDLLENPFTTSGPATVRVVQTPKGWHLLRDGWPYFIKGACVWGENVRFGDLEAAGGNSVRTYHSKYAQWTLDAAQRHGMTVMLGYEVNSEHGWFSYLDKGDLSRQRARFRDFVKKYKNHPALLVWGIGNEVEQSVEEQHREAMWKELNQLALIAKEIDPRHPTAIVLAGAGKDKLDAVKKWCPAVDIVCFNSYGPLRNLPEHLDKNGWQKPYIVTEFGAQGWWEAAVTPWGAPIELTSTQKAKEYLTSYQRGILRDRKRCLGSYVFFWEPKQEATATWFGMFLPSGERLEMIDAMTQAWARKRPRNRSPQIKALEFIGGKDRYLPGQPVRVKLAASDPEKKPLGIWWKIFEEAPPFTADNGYQIVPRQLLEHSTVPTENGAEFPAPTNPGPYRVFVFVYDGRGNAATGNLCFYVEPATPVPVATPSPSPEPTPP